MAYADETELVESGQPVEALELEVKLSRAEKLADDLVEGVAVVGACVGVQVHFTEDCGEGARPSKTRWLSSKVIRKSRLAALSLAAGSLEHMWKSRAS